MKRQTYRICRGSMVQTGFGSGFHGNQCLPTARTIQARTHKEATGKMDKFIRDAKITGSFYVKLES